MLATCHGEHDQFQRRGCNLSRDESRQLRHGRLRKARRFTAFVTILEEGRQRVKMRIPAYCLMNNRSSDCGRASGAVRQAHDCAAGHSPDDAWCGGRRGGWLESTLRDPWRPKNHRLRQSRRVRGSKEECRNVPLRLTGEGWGVGVRVFTLVPEEKTLTPALFRSTGRGSKCGIAAGYTRRGTCSGIVGTGAEPPPFHAPVGRGVSSGSMRASSVRAIDTSRSPCRRASAFTR